MSWDSAISDTFGVGKLALKIYQACDKASDDFQDTARLCLGIYVAVEQAQRSLPKPRSEASRVDRRNYASLATITSSCRTTLSLLEQRLRKYPSLGTAAPRTRDTIGYGLRTMMSDDLKDLQVQLNGQLQALNVFLVGLQGETLGGIVRRLDEITARMPSTLAGTDDTKSRAEIDSNLSSICEELAEHQAQSQVSSGSSGYAEASMKRALDEKRRKLQTTLDLHPDLCQSMRLLNAAEQSKLKPPGQTIHYSPKDEHLNSLPEGWQRITTSDASYQYQYLLTAKPIRTKIYTLEEPFGRTLDVDLDPLPEGWLESATSRGSYFYHPASGATQFERPSVTIVCDFEDHVVGFVSSTGLPLDLTDIPSLELARALYCDFGPPEVDIAASLPMGWYWSRDEAGRPLYTGPGIESTVHPAYFDPASRDTLSTGLRNGWEPRLDNWGQVFWVCHDQRMAQRTSPTRPEMQKT
ncbi:hypothetical protein MMC25_000401 [Agyrium rufum]|nr:hypothetical protein [Agyrium rufum]